MGAFLSAGVDSSSVVALMNEFQPPVTTCSIGFTHEKYDEASDARRFADSLETNHFEHTVEPRAIDLLPKLAWHYDERFADSSAVPTYYVSNVARQHVTVALSGDGGDENFAGYSRYRITMLEDRFRSRIPAAIRRNVLAPMGEWYPKLGWAPRMFRAKSTLQSLARDLLEAYFHLISGCPPTLKSQLLSGDVSNRLAGYDSCDVLRSWWDRADTTDPLSRIQYVDMKTYLADDILVKVDRASMANSLEVRSPLLDHKLMELVARIPSSLKLNHARGKHIFRVVVRVLPSEILSRKKQGFAVPVAEWFRGELKGFAGEVLFRNGDGLLNGLYRAVLAAASGRRARLVVAVVERSDVSDVARGLKTRMSGVAREHAFANAGVRKASGDNKGEAV